MEVLDMTKKIILCIPVLLLLFIAINYYKPIKVNDLIAPYSSEILPEKIHSFIFFSSQSLKELKVTGKESIKKIVGLIGNMKVRKKLISPNPYTPKIKDTYYFVFYGENKKIQSINILNNKYIEINNKPYSIIGTPNISSIYEIIILDQPKGSLDKFYYDLIHSISNSVNTSKSLLKGLQL
jgi:hypothetical protein